MDKSIRVEMPSLTEQPPRKTVSAKAAESEASLPGSDLARILEISVPVAAVLADRLMPVETILQMRPGTILEFDVPFGSDLSLTVGGRALGRGQAVKVGEHFGLRITAIDSIRHRIEALGKS